MAGATSTRETTTALAAEHETEPNLDVLTQAVALIAVSIAERSLQPEQLPEKCNIDVCKLGKLEKNRDAGSSHKRKASPQKKASPSRSLALALQDPDKLDGYRPKRLQEALVGNHGGSPFSGTQDATSSGHVGGPTKPACVKGGREKACAFDHAEGEDPYQVLDEDPYLGRRVDKGGLLGTIVECTRLYVVRYNDGSEDHIELPEQDAEESRKVEGIVRTVSHCSSVEEEEIASLKAQVEQLQGALRSSSQRSAVEEGALRSSSQRSAVEEVEQEKSPSFFRRVLSRITSWTPRRRRPSRLEDADLDSIERTPKRRDLRPSDTDLDACDPSPKLQRRLRPSDEDTDIHASDRSPKLRRLLQPSDEEIVRLEAPAEWTEVTPRCHRPKLPLPEPELSPSGALATADVATTAAKRDPAQETVVVISDSDTEAARSSAHETRGSPRLRQLRIQAALRSRVRGLEELPVLQRALVLAHLHAGDVSDRACSDLLFPCNGS
eukprot:TRINITY_DN14395_c0_g1_i3.p1 TRINITY_DN14395_c0_g1~~TRINITY_DN14395_c0_g1_i3.p1  ORF type:complete len:505 (+),score=87.00 TRINITY_DN14395_c0_g1_i3:31-1515(+)